MNVVSSHTLRTSSYPIRRAYEATSMESAAEVFSRLGTKEILGDLDLPLFSHLGSVQAGLAPASVVEVCGCEGVGKTELLLNMAARCVLPKSWKGVEMSGRGVGVVCICTDYKFSVLRLASVLDRRICSVLAHSSGADLSPSSKSAAAHTAVTSNAECQGQRVHMEIDQLIHECLSRIHLLYCSSVPELVAALDSLQTFLLGHPEVCLLMVDPADGFCWMDRVECRGCREFEQRQSQWVGALSRLSREHHLVVVATRLRFEGVHAAEDPLGRSWQEVVNYHYLLQRLDEGNSIITCRDSADPPPDPQVFSNPVPRSVFLVQQLLPPGPSWQFVVNEQGILFAN